VHVRRRARRAVLQEKLRELRRCVGVPLRQVAQVEWQRPRQHLQWLQNGADGLGGLHRPTHSASLVFKHHLCAEVVSEMVSARPCMLPSRQTS
jgi:hypothetical protein